MLVGNSEGEVQNLISMMGWKIKIREVKMAKNSIRGLGGTCWRWGWGCREGGNRGFLE